MQTYLNKKNTFFERILFLIDYYGIKNINSLAKDYLNYNSSEKINRLKKDNTFPSYEILIDISNKFEEVDLNWLLTGKGEMLLKSNSLNEKKAEVSIQNDERNNLNKEIVFKQREINLLIRESELHKKENDLLKIEIELLKTELEKIKNSLKK